MGPVAVLVIYYIGGSWDSINASKYLTTYNLGGSNYVRPVREAIRKGTGAAISIYQIPGALGFPLDVVLVLCTPVYTVDNST